MAENEEIIRKVSIDVGDGQAKLEQLAQAEQKLVEGSKESGTADEKAAAQTMTRAQRINEMRERLIDLIELERRDREEVTAGKTQSIQSTDVSENRRHEIDRLAASIAQAKASETEALAAIEKYTDHTNKAHDSTSLFADAAGKADTMLTGMVSGMITATGVATALAGALHKVAEAAKEAADAQAQVGKKQVPLASIIGGKRSEAARADINEEAEKAGFDVAGRDQLQEAVAREVQTHPEMTDEEIKKFAHAAAGLQEATGQGGAANADAIDSLVKNLGISQEKAASEAATLMTHGAQASDVAEIGRKFGRAGGQDFMGLVLAASQHGLPLGEGTRQAMGWIQGLTRTDENGRVSRGAMAAGITADMTPTQMVEAVKNAQGKLPPGMMNQLNGGPELAGVVGPLLEAVDSPDLAKAKTALQQPNVIQNAIAAQNEDQYVLSMRAKARDELKVQVSKETPSVMSAIGEVMEEHEAEQAAAGHGSRIVGEVKNELTGRSSDPLLMVLEKLYLYLSGKDKEFDQAREAVWSGSGTPATPAAPDSSQGVMQHITNIGTVYNQGDPTTRDSRRREFPQ